jgi:hypothetical protein
MALLFFLAFEVFFKNPCLFQPIVGSFYLAHYVFSLQGITRNLATQAHLAYKWLKEEEEDEEEEEEGGRRRRRRKLFSKLGYI